MSADRSSINVHEGGCRDPLAYISMISVSLCLRCVFLSSAPLYILPFLDGLSSGDPICFRLTVCHLAGALDELIGVVKVARCRPSALVIVAVVWVVPWGGPIAVKTRSYGALALPEACFGTCLEAWSLCFFACGVHWVQSRLVSQRAVSFMGIKIADFLTGQALAIMVAISAFIVGHHMSPQIAITTVYQLLQLRHWVPPYEEDPRPIVMIKCSNLNGWFPVLLLMPSVNDILLPGVIRIRNRITQQLYPSAFYVQFLLIMKYAVKLL
ncbi:hypothetical protein Tco_1256179 [Tanacetum coccineum]